MSRGEAIAARVQKQGLHERRPVYEEKIVHLSVSCSPLGVAFGGGSVGITLGFGETPVDLGVSEGAAARDSWRNGYRRR